MIIYVRIINADLIKEGKRYLGLIKKKRHTPIYHAYHPRTNMKVLLIIVSPKIKLFDFQCKVTPCHILLTTYSCPGALPKHYMVK